MNIKKGIESLARHSARRPWLTIGIWVASLVASFMLMSSLLGGALTTENEFTDDTESRQADTLLKERLGLPENNSTMDELVIVHSPYFTVDDPAYRSQVENLFGDITGLGKDVVLGGATYYMTGDETMVSADRHSTLIPLSMPPDGDKHVEEIYTAGKSYDVAGTFEVYYTGTASFNNDTQKLAEETMSKGETVGIMVALVVLAAVFGTIVAALLPVSLGIIAVVAALGLISIVGQFMDLSFSITNIVTMMGLAVGIDYSLFIVSRYREERKKGLPKAEAIAVTAATANQAIFFSGMTVVLALISLVVFPLAIFKSMGIGAILVVITAILASMTLLPAVLSLMGDKVNALRMPFTGRKNAKAENGRGFWAGLTHFVTRHAVISVVLVTGTLIAALTPFFDKNSGMSGISGLPDDLPAKAGFMVLQRDFHMGMDQPAQIVVDGDIAAPATQAAVAALKAYLEADKNFAAVVEVPHTDKNLAVIYASLAGDPMTKVSMDAVAKIRGDYVPAAFNDSGARALVTGATASILDFNQTTSEYTPWVFGFVLSLSFIILMVAFRSVVIPAKAIIMNLLSVGASYGLIVLVFQKGIGASFFGFQTVDVIESWLPLFLFALLFGLSMDYHVFLLSRIREHYIKTGNNHESVEFGLRSTGRLITGAALIMVAVFGGFALGDMVMFQQMGFGLAVAVFLDATLVRCILVPASMQLLGKYNWYLPKWLNWLPKVSLGEDVPAETKVSVPGYTVLPGTLAPVPVPVRVENEIIRA